MAELQMVKRKAQPGEVGLFVNSELFEEEFQTIKMGAEVTIKATTPATQKYNRFSWHIARLVADASDAFDTAEDARDYILIECRHFRRRFDKLRDKAEVIPKPTHNLDGTAWLKLIPRMVHVITTQFGIPEEAFSRQMREVRPDPRPEPPPHEDIPAGPAVTEPGSDAKATNAGGIQPVDASAEERPTDPPAHAKPRQRRAPGRDEALGPEPPAPTDPESYEAYALWHHRKHTDEAGFIVWWIGDEQWNLRQACGITVTMRKAIEAKMAEKFPNLNPKRQ